MVELAVKLDTTAFDAGIARVKTGLSSIGIAANDAGNQID